MLIKAKSHLNPLPQVLDQRRNTLHKASLLGCFGLDMRLKLIQEIRLCGALLESDFSIHFPQDAEPVLQYLSQHFNIEYHIGTQEIPLLENVSILHDKPLCKVGKSIEAPLIFPHEMVKKCKTKWEGPRSHQFSFCGLVTEKRKKCLETWLHTHFGRRGSAVNVRESTKKPGRLHRIYSYITRDFANNKKQTYPDIGLCIYTSDLGRQFPIKVWDEDYYNFLATSRFVLCPDGDFVWTYRFFESILCGAIPVVENTCDLYDGFEYFSMNDPIERLVYSDEMAKHNFLKAQQMLTVPLEHLNQCLTETLERI